MLTGIIGEGVASATLVVQLRLGENCRGLALPFRDCAMDYGFALSC